MERCSQLVYAFNSRQLIPTVFFLFFLSFNALGVNEEEKAIKRFAALCRQYSATAVSKIGQIHQTAVQKGKAAAHATADATVATAKALKPAAKFTAHGSWELTKAAIKGPIYPLWFTGMTAIDYLRSKEPTRQGAIKEALRRRWLFDKGGILSGGGLWILQQTTGLTANQFHKLTSDFDEANDDDGIIVIIDNFRGGDPAYPHGGKYVYERLYLPKYGKNKVFLIESAKLRDIPGELKRLAETHGPIKKLDYYGHGLVGNLFYDGDVTEGVAVNDGFKPIDETDPDVYTTIFTTKIADNIFAPGAHIRFNSCFVGNGPDGDLFVRGLANSWLRKGGTVYSSNVQILPSAPEFIGLRNNYPIVPETFRTIADHLTPGRGAITAYTLLSEIPGYTPNPDRVEGPYLTPGSRVNIHHTPGSSGTRAEFEKAWASEFRNSDSAHKFRVYDPDDFLHYAPFKDGTPSSVPYPTRQSVSRDFPRSLTLHFNTEAEASEYITHLKIDSEILATPIVSGKTVTFNQQKDVEKVVDRREYQSLVILAQKAKAKLKEVYIAKKAEANGDKKKLKEIEEAYSDYLNLLPLYAKPWFKDTDIPRFPEVVKSIEALKKPE